MRDKILFIVPPYVNYGSYTSPEFNERTVVKGKKILGSVVADMPIGLLSISSYLKEHCDIEIELIDFNVILNRLETFEYDSFRILFINIDGYIRQAGMDSENHHQKSNGRNPATACGKRELHSYFQFGWRDQRNHSACYQGALNALLIQETKCPDGILFRFP